MLADSTWEIWRMAEDNLGFTAVYLNSSVFWDVTQRRLVKTDVSGLLYIDSSETPVLNQRTLPIIPEDGITQLWTIRYRKSYMSVI